MAGRGAFNSRIGFIMAAVGSAVGLGNLWRFPQLVSESGGAAFVLLYLILLFVIGLPALLAELSIGRKRGVNAIQAFSVVKGRNWGWIGIIYIFTAVLLLSYYSVVAGHALRYLAESFTAPYFDAPGDYYAGIASGGPAIIYHALFMLITIGILVRGVGPGIEKANLVMMPFLFLSVVAIAIYGLTLDSPGFEGFKFYTEPDLSALTAGGFSGTAALLGDAAGQTFFSIGLGLGTMLTYASYIDRKSDLQSTGMTIGFADTGVAVIAGLMVFPLLFGLGLGGLAEEGNGLFVALPAAFAEIGGTLGGVFAGGFFLLLVFAALSSALSLLEVPVSYIIDRTNWGRPRAVLLMGLSVYVLGLPAALWGDYMDFADSLVGPLLLLGGFLLAIYVGWLDRSILDEMRIGAKRDWGKMWASIIRYPLPVVLGSLFIFSVIGFFRNLF
ncbi:MAG: sodium-dependent transporter [Thermoplasmatota archaeon]